MKIKHLIFSLVTINLVYAKTHLDQLLFPSVGSENHGQCSVPDSLTAHLMSTHGPYPVPIEPAPHDVNGCHLMSSFVVSRSCGHQQVSKKSVSEFLDRYRHIEAFEKLGPYHRPLRFIDEMMKELREEAGECTSCGLNEVIGIGERFDGDRPLEVSWEVTHQHRSQQTAQAWKSKLGKQTFVTKDPVRFESCLANNDTMNVIHLSVLSPFDTCRGYSEFVQRIDATKPWHNATRFIEVNDEVVHNLANPRFFKVKPEDAAFLAKKVYEFCQYDISVGKNAWRWCSFLSEKALAAFGEEANLEACMKMSSCPVPGEQQQIGFRHVCPLVRKMIDFLDHNRNASIVPVSASFTDVKTLLPYITFLLGWDNSPDMMSTASASANVRVDLHNCGNVDTDPEWRVAVYVNEKMVPVPKCVKPMGCLWSELKGMLQDVIKHLGGCDVDAYADMCKNIGCFVIPGSA